jgi:hypothetical protein
MEISITIHNASKVGLPASFYASMRVPVEYVQVFVLTILAYLLVQTVAPAGAVQHGNHIERDFTDVDFNKRLMPTSYGSSYTPGTYRTLPLKAYLGRSRDIRQLRVSLFSS